MGRLAPQKIVISDFQILYQIRRTGGRSVEGNASDGGPAVRWRSDGCGYERNRAHLAQRILRRLHILSDDVSYALSSLLLH